QRSRRGGRRRFFWHQRSRSGVRGKHRALFAPQPIEAELQREPALERIQSWAVEQGSQLGRPAENDAESLRRVVLKRGECAELGEGLERDAVGLVDPCKEVRRPSS